jgi:hypothetical protein
MEGSPADSGEGDALMMKDAISKASSACCPPIKVTITDHPGRGRLHVYFRM